MPPPGGPPMQNPHGGPPPQQPPSPSKNDASKMQIEKGSVCWYRDSDGSAKKVEVVSVDRAIIPPSYVIRIDGRERETEVICLGVCTSCEPVAILYGLVHRHVSAHEQRPPVTAELANIWSSIASEAPGNPCIC